MERSKTHLIESVFAGGGDMGARIRAFDWSATDLGPVEHWPHSLRACVRIVLGAGHPMLVSWGPDYTAFFSNVSHEFRTPLALMLGPLEEVLPETRERLT